MADRDLTTSDEIWYPIPGLPGHQLSSELRVRKPRMKCEPGRPHQEIDRTHRTVERYFCRQVERGDSASHTGEKTANGPKWESIKLSLAIAYGPTPDGLFVRHYDDNVNNNYASNLCFGTAADNSADMVRNGRSARGERNSGCKLTEDAVRDIRSRKRTGWKFINNLAAEFDVNRVTIRWIRSGRMWKHIQ